MKRIFRLFISSTFSDFEIEREFLQTAVFPKLTQYCQSVGYQFQPIDLRWGVQAEAQLDQKTLEVCLNQVRACKHFPHPNFLIMVGHRYGWVPLPYAIEHHEFLRIRNYLKGCGSTSIKQRRNINKEGAADILSESLRVKLLEQWYRHDKNYLYQTESGHSTAYVLTPRKAEFESAEIWEAVETQLRNMLQEAVATLGLTGKEREKYFLSATEHEVVEGIFDYGIGDAFKARETSRVDSEYVFGFLRGKEEDCDDDNVRRFRQSLHNAIPAHNLFVNESGSDYLEAFAASLIAFLKRCIDHHVARVSDVPLLKQEMSEQNAYLTQKLTNFFGRENALAKIDAYMDGPGDYPGQPMVVFGTSGIGKSSILAKAVERACSRGHRVIFRFVGATPDSSSSRSLLTSICQECSSLHLANSGHGFEDQGESFKEFSIRVSRFLGELEIPLVIVIDALDQLANDDEFLWLPEALPPNLKIVLSVLNDSNYQEDSRYFSLLRRRYLNLYELPTLPDVGQLLDDLLVSRSRTLQPRQLSYVLRQYNKSCSPLYLRIVLEEVINWKSFEGTKFLGNDQREAIAAFIRNLSSYYHHHPDFVDRVLGYILASDEGITETELIEVCSSNPSLLQRLAPETFHINATRKLPMAVWARLHFQLQSFLVIKYSEGGYGLLNFFHREFRDATKAVVPLKAVQEELVRQLEKIIAEIQHQPFSINRWGKLYALTVSVRGIHHQDEPEIQAAAAFVCGLESEEWIREYVRFVESRGDFYNQYNQMSRALVYNLLFCDLVTILYRREDKVWMPARIRSLTGLAGTYYNLNRLNESSSLEAQAIDILDIYAGTEERRNPVFVKLQVQTLLNHSATLEKLNSADASLGAKEKAFQILQGHLHDPEFDDLRLKCLIELSYHHGEHLGDTVTALSLGQQALDLAQRLQREDEDQYLKYYVATLVNTAIWVDDLDRVIAYEQQALEIVKVQIKRNRSLWVVHYATCLNNLAFSYEQKGRVEDAEAIFKDVLDDVRKRYLEDRDRWTRAYAKSLTNIGQFYLNQTRMDLALENFSEAFDIVKMKYQVDQKDWSDQYLKKGMNLAEAYRARHEFKKCTQLESGLLAIAEGLYAAEPEKWREAYGFILNKAIATCQELQRKKSLSILRKKNESLCCNHGSWNAFYKKNPVVISTVFQNR